MEYGYSFGRLIRSLPRGYRVGNVGSNGGVFYRTQRPLWDIVDWGPQVSCALWFQYARGFQVSVTRLFLVPVVLVLTLATRFCRDRSHDCFTYGLRNQNSLILIFWEYSEIFLDVCSSTTVLCFKYSYLMHNQNSCRILGFRKLRGVFTSLIRSLPRCYPGGNGGFEGPGT